MDKIKVTKCEQKGRKIILEFEPKFLQGDEIYTMYHLSKDELNSVEYDIRIKGYDGKPIEADVKYGHNFYTKSHAQLCNMRGAAKTKKDAARMWYGNKEHFLTGSERYKQIIQAFKDDEEFLNEVEAIKEKMISDEKKKKLEDAMAMIEKGTKILKECGGDFNF